jgi:capsular polysaccharide biosynthesis protein
LEALPAPQRAATASAAAQPSRADGAIDVLPQQPIVYQPVVVPQVQPQAVPQRRLTLGGMILAVLIAVVVAGVVYAGSKHLSATYQANASFVVEIPAEGGLSDPTVTAANDIATQYAQLATAAPVLDAAAKTLKVNASTLSGKIQGSTISAQNIVQVTASATDPGRATAIAQAVDVALVEYIRQLESSTGAQFNAKANVLLAPLNAEITGLRTKIAGERLSRRGPDESALQTLIAQQASEISQLATDTAGSQPSLQVVSGGASASQIAPKPKEYAVIGLVVALILALRAVYVIGPPRIPGRRRATAA